MTPHNHTTDPLFLYQLQRPYNSAIAGLSLELLEDSVRRILIASKRFPDAQTTAIVAGRTATLEAHVKLALAHSRRLNITACGIWDLVSVHAKVWNCADFATRLLLNRAIYPSLRATLLSRSALASGVAGEWFFATDEAPPKDLLAPCPAVKGYVERCVCGALNLDSVELEIMDRWGRPYICASSEGLFRVRRFGPAKLVY